MSCLFLGRTKKNSFSFKHVLGEWTCLEKSWGYKNIWGDEVKKHLYNNSSGVLVRVYKCEFALASGSWNVGMNSMYNFAQISPETAFGDFPYKLPLKGRFLHLRFFGFSWAVHLGKRFLAISCPGEGESNNRYQAPNDYIVSFNCNFDKKNATINVSIPKTQKTKKTLKLILGRHILLPFQGSWVQLFSMAAWLSLSNFDWGLQLQPWHCHLDNPIRMRNSLQMFNWIHCVKYKNYSNSKWEVWIHIT